MVGSKHSDRGFEVVERVKGLVDAREPEVRHLVELSERPEDCQADLIGVNLRAPARADRLLDPLGQQSKVAVSYTHLRAHETRHDIVCRLLLEKKKKTKTTINQTQHT